MMRFSIVPVDFFDNDKFWNFVYSADKAKEVEDCLPELKPSVFSKNEPDTCSPEPGLLFKKMYQQKIFSTNELYQLIDTICAIESVKHDLYKIVAQLESDEMIKIKVTDQSVFRNSHMALNEQENKVEACIPEINDSDKPFEDIHAYSQEEQILTSNARHQLIDTSRTETANMISRERAVAYIMPLADKPEWKKI